MRSPDLQQPLGYASHVHFVLLHVVLLHVQALNFEQSISNKRALPVGLLHSRFQSSVNKMLRKRLISSSKARYPFPDSSPHFVFAFYLLFFGCVQEILFCQ